MMLPPVTVVVGVMVADGCKSDVPLATETGDAETQTLVVIDDEGDWVRWRCLVTVVRCLV